MELITPALAAGAMAALTGVSTPAVADAYARLKTALSASHPRLAGRVQALEAWPDSTIRRDLLAADLEGAGVDGDLELARLALDLAEAIEREAPRAAFRAGVDLARARTRSHQSSRP